MDNISLIAAIGKNKELGKNNELIWHIKEDLKFFKNQTINKNIVMGINTFNSLPKLLPQRKHIILTHQEVPVSSNVMIFHELKKLLEYIENNKNEFMIIGGASIYRQFLEYAKKMYLTQIKAIDRKADVYFPDFLENEWNVDCLYKGEENNIKYEHLVYTRKITD